MTLRTQRPARQAGVTLIELAIVLTIIGVIAVMAVPSIIDRWQRETVIALAERLASAMSLAQTTAQHRRVWTYLGPQTPALKLTGGWALTLSPPGTPSGEPPLLFISPPALPAVHIRSNLPGDTLAYAPVGYSRRIDTNGQLGGRIWIISGRHERQVVINWAGRPRICNPTADSSCTSTGNDP